MQRRLKPSNIAEGELGTGAHRVGFAGGRRQKDREKIQEKLLPFGRGRAIQACAGTAKNVPASGGILSADPLYWLVSVLRSSKLLPSV